MQILFVEDHETFVSQMLPLLQQLDGVSGVDHVKSLASARAAIAVGFFDLVILDLTIPPSDEASFDKAKEHGQTVFHEMRSVAPGTPIFILTGSEPDEFSRRLARYGEKYDIWGSGAPTNTVDYFLKEEADKLVDRVAELATIVDGTDKIVLDTRGRDVGLTPEHMRILKTFARKARGVSCEVQLLGGGLSSALVVKATPRDGQGRPQAICAGKLGSRTDVEKESAAYEQHVKRLGTIGGFPPVFCTIDKAVGGQGGIFYTLAEDEIGSLFDLIAREPAEAAQVVRSVRSALQRWATARDIAEIEVADIRRRLVDDEVLAELRVSHDISFIDQVEVLHVRAAASFIHGDLHAGNILVRAKGEPVLIDFGDVGQGFACLDPVTLELSLLFHPDGVRLGSSQVLSQVIQHWPDVDRYIEGNVFGPVIEMCREWAHDVGGGDKDVLVAGYAYGLRQLKYGTVDSTVTLQLLNSIAAKLCG